MSLGAMTNTAFLVALRCNTETLLEYVSFGLVKIYLPFSLVLLSPIQMQCENERGKKKNQCAFSQ